MGTMDVDCVDSCACCADIVIILWHWVDIITIQPFEDDNTVWPGVVECKIDLPLLLMI